MAPELLQKVNLFYLLHCIDIEFAEKTRKKGCPYCNGPLHYAKYTRQPRGGPENIPGEYLIRFSLCCGHCRHRTLPPSCMFFGRRVYWGAVILVVLTFQTVQVPEKYKRYLISQESLWDWGAEMAPDHSTCYVFFNCYH